MCEQTILKFTETLPTYNQNIAFIDPEEPDRWEIGWMDSYHIRIEGGTSYKPEQLTYFFLLPEIP